MCVSPQWLKDPEEEAAVAMNQCQKQVAVEFSEILQEVNRRKRPRPSSEDTGPLKETSC